MPPPHVVGCLPGTAVGDALGLPYEGLSRRRAARVFGPPDRHRFVFGRGMVSDDTEHTCLVAQSLIAAGVDTDAFCRSLGWRFRFWLLGLPAGIGLATLRALLRLWLGFSPHKSGVFSAGNGPAMRAAILGASIDDRQTLRELVRASTRITHTDPKAEHGAFAVALAAQLARQPTLVTPLEYVDQLRTALNGAGEELLSLVTQAADSAMAGQSTVAFADSIGQTRGVSGYVLHTVPVALHAWFMHPRDYRSAVMSIIECGGDTDSTAAIVGGLVGSAVGKAGLPADWLETLCEWPRTIAWLEQLGTQLADSLTTATPTRPLRLPIWGLALRNLFFLLVVLYHGFRRLLPPY